MTEHMTLTSLVVVGLTFSGSVVKVMTGETREGRKRGEKENIVTRCGSFSQGKLSVNLAFQYCVKFSPDYFHTCQPIG